MTITLSPASSTVHLNGANDPLVLTIQISNPDALAIGSWAFDLSYDPAVFAPVSGIGTAPAQGLEVDSYIPGAFATAMTYNPSFAPTIIRAGVLNFSGTSGNTANGVLGKLTLDAIGKSAGSSLSLLGTSEVLLSSGLAVQGIVYNPCQVSVTPEPASMGLLLLGAIGLIRRRR